LYPHTESGKVWKTRAKGASSISTSGYATMKNMKEQLVCIYHKDCVDGTMAAAILLREYPEAELFPLSYGYGDEELSPIIERIDENTLLYILDFSLIEEGGKNMEKLFAKNPKKIINIDHHISAKETLEKLDTQYKNFEFIFDNTTAAAPLTWKHFNPDKPIPLMVELVGYGDTWQLDKDTRIGPVVAYLTMLLGDPQNFITALETPLEKVVEKGEVISDYIDFLIGIYVKKTDPNHILVGNNKVLAFNASFTLQQIRSRLGNVLAKKYGETIGVYRITGGNVNISFRGLDTVEPSARELAEVLGGGGHRNSAGAGMTLSEFLKILDK
jgi:oligoribonuclease NrnB/cAMP/cGMP phosphodiesterase (DHH superfamily)